ncbi:MAG: hypothetical protein AAGA18_03720 [Verrucomicrobiota bacterium]
MKSITKILTLCLGLFLPIVIEAEVTVMGKVQSPTCSLDEEALEERKNTILKQIKDKTDQVERMKEGYRLRFPRSEENIKLTTSIILLESQCCPFLNFHITALAGSDDIQFTITAPPDAQHLIDELFVLNEKSSNKLLQSTSANAEAD